MVTDLTPFPVGTFIGRLLLQLSAVILVLLAGILSVDTVGCTLQQILPTDGLCIKEPIEVALLFIGAPLVTFINFP